MRRLTDRFIRGLKTKRGKAYEQEFDSVARGLAARCTDTGAKSFYFVYRMGGKKKWLRVGDASDLRVFSLADARDKVTKLRALIADDKDPIEERRRAEAARLDPSAERCSTTTSTEALVIGALFPSGLGIR